MLIQDLGVIPYRDAWALQEQAHADVLAGGEPRLLLLQHPPVITFGRRGATEHLLTPEPQLREMGVELVESDRGGDVTFHGPGQLVAYPILRLADHRLSVSAYVHTLERLVIDTLAEFGVTGHTDPTAVGVWVHRQPETPPAKVAAIGVRIRRGVSLHGLALNVSTDLRFFNLITPCGLAGRPVTSLLELLGDRSPRYDQVQSALARHAAAAFAR
jgi:lipoate-protein ligase B